MWYTAVMTERRDPMRAEERRQAIRELLQRAKQPVSATALAAQFSVSRQIIVGDIALLRAAGADISATPRGYVILRETGGLVRQVAVQHDAAGMGEELNAMVDQGCTVLDVIVDHPIYGQLTGPLQLSNRYDVGQFLSRCAQSDARPLSELRGSISTLSPVRMRRHSAGCAGSCGGWASCWKVEHVKKQLTGTGILCMIRFTGVKTPVNRIF